MIASFDLETVRQNSANEYRAARIALLTMRVRRMIDQTDEAARNVENVLARIEGDLGGRRPIDAYWLPAPLQY
jgi:hypothetical protein